MSRLVAMLVVMSSLIAAAAEAKVIVVNPGPGTPLQDAIDAAAPGDTLRLTGSFNEAIVIDRRLKIAGTNGFYAIDAGCNAATAVTIAADGVQLDLLSVRGGATTNVLVQGRDHVTLRRLQILSSCPGVQRGLDAVAATRLTVRDVGLSAWDVVGLHRDNCPPLHGANLFYYGDAAVRLADTPGDGHVRVATTNICTAAPIGILIENTADLPSGPAAVTLQRGFLRSNDRGIVLRETDGVSIRSIHVDGDDFYASEEGVTGIELDANSDDNVLAQNEIKNHASDVSDAGSSNCWRMTKFETGSVPTTGCP